MNLYLLLVKCLTALKEESELSLAYLFGGQPHDIDFLRLKKKFSGFFLQSLIFIFIILKKFNLRSNSQSQKSIYAYAESANQYNALSSTILKILENNDEIKLTTENSIKVDEQVKQYSQPLKASFKVIFTALVIFIIKAPSLYFSLKNASKHKKSRFYINQFYLSYFYLPYFLDELKKSKPMFVLMSNDINVACRSLKLAAKTLNIKSVYLQHGSVSKIYPPLEHNYIFLDGQASLEIYRACENDNYKNLNKYLDRKIFLSGNKKNLKKLELNKNQIGIAVNRLDDLENIKILCSNLIKSGYNVRLRFHPGMINLIKKNFINIFKNNSSFECIDPEQESISEFCGNIFCLIAGNTSTHLEAAICGVIPIYFNSINVDYQYDYYSFVKNGLSYEANSVQDILSIINKIQSNQLKLNNNAVNYFSSTFQTQWQGREGELVASHLLSISRNIDPKELFGYTTI
jgi:hypothetical protein